MKVSEWIAKYTLYIQEHGDHEVEFYNSDTDEILQIDEGETDWPIHPDEDNGDTALVVLEDVPEEINQEVAAAEDKADEAAIESAHKELSAELDAEDAASGLTANEEALGRGDELIPAMSRLPDNIVD